jgi:hypothetical protein
MERIFLWLIPVLVLGALATLYFWPGSEKPQPQQLSAPALKPAIRYPMEAHEPPADSLPPLADSDGVIADALAELFGQRLPEFVYLKSIVHRVVATVDNLPRDHLSMRLMPVTPVTGMPITEKSGESLVLSPKNFARYRPYVRLADAVPAEALVAVYARFYPLFQQQYENLGYPDKYFNDRAVEVIDHLLATPEAREPVHLVQPGVLYKFADPRLESLSAGQKTFLRMGSANAAKLKSKLRDIRRGLVSMAAAKGE